MIREVTTWKWSEGSFFSKKHWLFISKTQYFKFTASEKDEIINLSKNFPVSLGHDYHSSNKRYWLYKDKVYWENDKNSPKEMKLLLDEKIEKRTQKIERLMLKESAL